MVSMRFSGIEVCYIPSAQKITTKEKRPMIKGNYYKLLASMTAMLTFALNQCKVFAYDESLKKGLPRIAEAELLILDYGFAIGRLVCVTMAIFEILKSIKDGNTQAFWGIIIKYLIALGSLKLLPLGFDLISGFFS